VQYRPVRVARRHYNQNTWRCQTETTRRCETLQLQSRSERILFPNPRHPNYSPFLLLGRLAAQYRHILIGHRRPNPNISHYATPRVHTYGTHHTPPAEQQSHRPNPAATRSRPSCPPYLHASYYRHIQAGLYHYRRCTSSRLCPRLRIDESQEMVIRSLPEIQSQNQWPLNVCPFHSLHRHADKSPSDLIAPLYCGQNI